MVLKYVKDALEFTGSVAVDIGGGLIQAVSGESLTGVARYMDERESPMHLAARQNNVSKIVELDQKGVDLFSTLHVVECGFISPLESAARCGASASVKMIAILDTDRKYHEGHYVSAMLYAAENNDLQTMKALKQVGVDINASKDSGNFHISASHKDDYSPVAIALKNSNFDTADSLIQMGANLNCVSATKGTALHMAAQEKNLQAAKYALSKGVDINAVNVYGHTALYYAAERGDEKMVEYLLQNGAKTNIHDIEGNTPLHYAVHGRQYKIIEMLTVQGQADLNAKNNDKLTPEQAARDAKTVQVLQELKEKYPVASIKESPKKAKNTPRKKNTNVAQNTEIPQNNEFGCINRLSQNADKFDNFDEQIFMGNQNNGRTS